MVKPSRQECRESEQELLKNGRCKICMHVIRNIERTVREQHKGEDETRRDEKERRGEARLGVNRRDDDGGKH